VALQLLIINMQDSNSRNCQLQSSVASHEFTLSEWEEGFKAGSSRQSALMAHAVQCNIPSVIIMSTPCVFLTPCDQSHGNGAWLPVVDGYRLFPAHIHKLQANFFRGKLSSVSKLSIGFILLSSWVFHVHLVWNLCCFNQPRIVVSGFYYPSVPYPLSVIMVRSGKSHRSRGHRDSCLPSSVGHLVEPEQVPFNPSPIHETDRKV